LGNGPSLKTQNMSLLSDEYVFTVNQMSRHSEYHNIKSNYHFWADPMFFVIDDNKSEDFEMLEVFENVNTDINRPECFFPLEQLNFIKKHKLDETLNVNYFYSKYIFHENYNSDIDFSRIIPGFGTVIQWAIVMAIYMGFSEIYLLGCDNTTIIVTLNSALKKNSNEDYVYSITENEKKRMEKLLNYHSIEEYCKAYTETLAGYRKLYKYCKSRNIKLINCSAETVIDSIPRERFENIMNVFDHG
jgi:hypothetical protein